MMNPNETSELFLAEAYLKKGNLLSFHFFLCDDFDVPLVGDGKATVGFQALRDDNGNWYPTSTLVIVPETNIAACLLKELPGNLSYNVEKVPREDGTFAVKFNKLK